MTLHQFQSALAYMIRLPQPNQQKNLEQAFLEYELTPAEKSTLEYLANHHLVNAYGNDMLDARWRIINRAISCVYPLIEQETLKQLWRQDFEPKYFKTSFLDINTQFLEYLVTDGFARESILPGRPEYCFDVLKYLCAVYCFSKNTLPVSPQLPTGSYLSHGCFKIISLEYDVREYCDELFAGSLPNGTPPKGPVTLLFLADDVPTEFRSFEIDDELKNFLTSQLTNPPPNATLPACYNDIVDLGLCLATNGA